MAVQPGAAFTAPPTAYVADHDTAPQQVVRNDATSLLIRTLQNKKAKEEAKRKQAKAAGAWGSGAGARGGTEKGGSLNRLVRQTRLLLAGWLAASHCPPHSSSCLLCLLPLPSYR